MPLEGCDVLLGMPWFYNHKAVLDSFNKKNSLENRDEYADCFSESLPGQLPPELSEVHTIDLIPGSAAPNKPPYRVSATQQEEIMMHVNELLQKGHIQPSSSPFCSLVLLVQKKDGSRRCIDYTALNKITGFVLLTILSSVPSLKKAPPCVSATVCPRVQGTPYSILMAGMYLVALGSGGLRVNLSSHGGDQFDEADAKERLGMSSFFNWFFFCLALGFGIASTFLVYIQEYVSFALGFGLSIVLLFVGLSVALVGAPAYRFEVPVGSPLTRIAQVLVAAFGKRHQKLPTSPLGLYEVNEKEVSAPHIAHIPHTGQYRCLDKAAVLELIEDKGNSWRLCTVTQVEEVKALLRMMPIWATTIMLNVCLAQLLTFSIEQGVTTDRTLGSIKIPAASLVTFPVLMLVIASPLYEMAFVPLVRKFTGRPTGITYLQRIGVGLFMAVVSMAIAGMVERRRVRIAAQNGLLDNPNVLLGLESIPMSVFWLVPQYLAFGIADLFTYVGVLEFFYHEAPEGMRSLGTGISQSTLALGYFLSTTIVSIVKRATGHGNSGGWLPDNLNRSRLDYFYWMLAVINILNFGLFQICAYYYRYRPRSAPASPHHHPNDAGSFTEDAFLPPSSPIHNGS
ncbi:hypothetical protein L7F22_060246 [Adiantum nelumboides]|nr:hypothetical protein [Adiantum nelumboides]